MVEVMDPVLDKCCSKWISNNPISIEKGALTGRFFYYVVKFAGLKVEIVKPMMQINLWYKNALLPLPQTGALCFEEYSDDIVFFRISRTFDLFSYWMILWVGESTGFLLRKYFSLPASAKSSVITMTPKVIQHLRAFPVSLYSLCCQVSLFFLYFAWGSTCSWQWIRIAWLLLRTNGWALAFMSNFLSIKISL